MKRPLLVAAVALSLGIGAAYFLPFRLLWLFQAVGVLGFALVPFIVRRPLSSLVVWILFFLAGVFLYALKVHFPPEDRVDQFSSPSGRVHLQARVAEVLEMAEREAVILDVRAFRDESGRWHSARGRVLLRPEPGLVLAFEDSSFVEAEGEIVDMPLGRFAHPDAFARWLSARGIALVMLLADAGDIQKLKMDGQGPFDKFLKNLRTWCSKTLSKGLTDESSAHALLQAMVLGTRAGVAADLKEAFLFTNTIHVLSVSGLHLTVILGAVLIVLGLFAIPPRWSSGLALAAVWIYALMTGLRPPIVRSAVMASFYLAGRVFRKKSDLANSLGASAVAMLVYQPLYLFDPGFQLSFLCLASLIFLGPRIEKDLSFLEWVSPDLVPLLLYRRERWLAKAWHAFLKLLAASGAVWIGVLPVIAYHFGLFSPVTVLANLVAIPLVSLIMNLGFGALLFGFWDHATLAFNAVNEIFLNTLVRAMDLLSRVPGAYFFVNEPTWVWLLAYGFVVGLGLFFGAGRVKSLYFFLASLVLIPLNFPDRPSGVLRMEIAGRGGMTFHLIGWPQGGRSLWAEVSQGPSERGLHGVGRLALTFKTRRVDQIFCSGDSGALKEELQALFRIKEVNSGIPEWGLQPIQHGDIWLSVLKAGEDRAGLANLPGKGILILEDVQDAGVFLKAVDRLNVLGVVFTGEMDRKIPEELTLRGIPSFRVSGQPLVLETDGTSIFVTCDS